jgi:hypothetical protein
MRDMDHPHIVRLREVFYSKRYIYLILDMCSGGELFHLVTGTILNSIEYVVLRHRADVLLYCNVLVVCYALRFHADECVRCSSTVLGCTTIYLRNSAVYNKL